MKFNKETAKPSIVVVGLLSDQAKRLERKLKGIVTLRFIDAESHVRTLPQATHCVLMQKFISHTWTDRAWKQFSRSRVHYVTGGATELERLIRGFTASQP